jgi:hypothetical protein
MGDVVESNPSQVPKLSGSNDPFEREERYLLTRKQVAGFASAISPEATLETYDRVRPVSYTRTTYFDTDDFAYFRSCDGPLARRLRLREYAMASSLEEEPVLSGIAFIELKQNAGTARSKVRLSASPALLGRLLGGARREEPVDSDLAGLPLSALSTILAEVRTPTMAPRLSTWYRRACMTAEGGRVRITLDEQLAFCLPHPLGRPGMPVGPRPGDVIAAGPARILEIKLWGRMPAWLDEAVAGLHPVPTFSKFRMGMLALSQRFGSPSVTDADSPLSTLFALSPEMAR